MPSIAKLLIQHGAYLSARNIYGSTALHFAARAGNEELCRMLLDTIGIFIDTTDSVEVTKLVFFNFLISKHIYEKGKYKFGDVFFETTQVFLFLLIIFYLLFSFLGLES